MSELAPSPAQPAPQGGLGAVREAWLFTSGSKSVRIVRAGANSRMFLHIYGPDHAVDTQTFDDVLCCMRYQSELERKLIAEGFSLDRFAVERRSGSDRRGAARSGFDRRLSLAPPPGT